MRGVLFASYLRLKGRLKSSATVLVTIEMLQVPQGGACALIIPSRGFGRPPWTNMQAWTAWLVFYGNRDGCATLRIDFVDASYCGWGSFKASKKQSCAVYFLARNNPLAASGASCRFSTRM